VYIIFLPAVGIVSEIVQVFSRRVVVGYTLLATAALATVIIAFGVWVHHMFAVGISPMATDLFSLASVVIGIPAGVQIFAWLATILTGKPRFSLPLMWIAGFIFVFVIGGLSGVMFPAASFDQAVTDSYFVVAHFHYVLVPGAIFSIMAGVYYWLPKWTGNMYDMKLAKLHFWLSAIFVNVLFFPQHFLGLAGMPRRIPDYAVQFTDWNRVSSIGGFAFGLSQLLFPYLIWKCVRGGARVGNKVWDGAHGLEWELPSPPPYHSWTEPPSETIIARGAEH